MKHKVFSGFGGVMVVFLMVACTSNSVDSVSLEEKLAHLGFTIRQQVDQANNPKLSGWSAIDRKHLIINFGASRYYLLTLRTACNPVLTAPSIGFGSASRSLSDNDQVLVSDSREHVAHCYISTIHQLEKVKAADT